MRNAITALLALSLVGLAAVYLYRSTARENVTGEREYRLGNRYLADGHYDEALVEFGTSLSRNPGYAPSCLGAAIARMHLGQISQAFASFERAIDLKPEFGEAFANRGILNDREGNYEQALADYRRALQLKPDLGDGPGMIWRFLHSPHEKPSTLTERVAYIAQELQKPLAERRLHQPEQDSEQQMYAK
jgi:tetratricopeptide (TPR) repeat protein